MGLEKTLTQSIRGTLLRTQGSELNKSEKITDKNSKWKIRFQ